MHPVIVQLVSAYDLVTKHPVTADVDFALVLVFLESFAVVACRILFLVLPLDLVGTPVVVVDSVAVDENQMKLMHVLLDSVHHWKS